MDSKIKILRKGVIFITIGVLFNIFLIKVYYKKVATKKAYFISDIYFDSKVDSINTLVLGHSRANFAINDTLLDGVFNYACYGESNVYTYYKLKKILLTRNHKIKRVIIPIGLSTFFSYKDPSLMDHSYWNRWLNYSEIGDIQNDKATYYSVYIHSKLFPYSKMLITLINKQESNYRLKNPELNEIKTEQDKYAFAKKSVDNHFDDRNYYDEVSYHYLKKLLNLCKENNIDVIAIRYPITKYYKLTFLSKMESLDVGESKFINLLKDNKVEIWDEENLFFHKDEMFKDFHHLNDKGRLEFTKHIKSKLNSK